MKKGFCIVLSTVLAVMSFAACNKNTVIDEDAITYINEDGSAYVEVTDKNGEAVTDAEGETVTSVLNKKDVSKLEKEKSKASKNEKADETTTAGIANLEDLANSDMQITANQDDLLITEKPKPTTTAKAGEKTTKSENTTTTTSAPKKDTLREKVIVNVIKTKKFTLKTNIVSNGTKIPATIAFDGNNLCMDITYSGWNMRLLSLDGKMYLVFPALKMYSESGDSDDTLGDFSSLNAEQNYVKTSTVDDKKSGTKYTCEEYYSDGAAIRYYFDKNNNWKRWESIDEDGNATAFEVSEFSGKVDSKLFSLKGFTKLSEDNISSLLGQ